MTSNRRIIGLAATLALVLSAFVATTQAQETNIHSLPSDLTVPPVIVSAPKPGLRVRQRRDNLGPNEFARYHALYLPPEWKPGEKYPVLVEYPGNGGYKNALGDVSNGRLEDCKLGYGISGGKGMIWICMPFVQKDRNRHEQVLNWWGDPDETAKYCYETVARICREYGGDPDRVILCGFSRGAIACNYIGLRDDTTAKLWRAFIPHSHYDGVRRWGQPEDDEESAAKRLARMQGRPQFITHEKSIAATEAYLRRHDALVGVTLVPLPYPNHSDEWVLKDIPERRRLRAWLAEVLK